MQVFVRGDCTMIAAPVQCDVDGVPKGSHYITVSTIKVRLRSFLINGHGRLSAHARTDALAGQLWRPDGESSGNDDWRSWLLTTREARPSKISGSISAGLRSRSQLRLRRAPWTISAFRADALMASPSWKSMARTDLLSKRVLKSPFGSFSWAPFGNVSRTAFLRASPMQTMPSWDQTGTPSGREGFFHFTSSITHGSPPLIRARSWPSLSPLQPVVFRTMASICWDADASFMPMR